MPVLAAMRKRKARRVREAVGRSVHDFGNHRQRAYRPRTDTWNEQQFGEVDRRPIRCGSQIGVKARRQHIACPDIVMGRHDQMRQRKLRRNGWCRSFNPARQSRQFARDPVRPQGVQNAKLTAARGPSTAIGEIDDLPPLPCLESRGRRPMPDFRRQISYPRDLGESASSRGGGGGAGKGEAWMRIRRRLRAELGEEVFSSWFGCLELDALSDQDVYLSVPTKFLKSWIQSHYVDRILPTLASEFPAIKRVSINVRCSTRPATPCATGGLRDLVAGAGADSARGPNITSFAASLPTGPSGATTAASKRPALADACEAEGLTGSPLDRRLIFSNFLVGGSNQLAHSEAQRIADAGPADPLLYNPLYLHASVGLGKTHLLQAVAHAATSARRRVIYLTAERFMYGSSPPSRHRQRLLSRNVFGR